VTRCQKKISATFSSETYSKAFHAWAATKEDLTDATSSFIKTIKEALAGDRNTARSQKLLCCAITAAWLLLDGKHIPEPDDPAPAFQESEEITDAEINDDDKHEHETLDAVDRRKNPVYCFIRKISRYSTACSIIVQELAFLYRSGTSLDIRFEAVPISDDTRSTPAKEGEYETLGDFLSGCLNTNLQTLEPDKIDGLQKSWSHTRQKDSLILHAEMQLALFYSLNPSLSPIQGFIGVSKRCCWCCNFVLKYVISFCYETQLNTAPTALGTCNLISILPKTLDRLSSFALKAPTAIHMYAGYSLTLSISNSLLISMAKYSARSATGSRPYATICKKR
jgi:OTT_1508-like deaminase